MKNFVTKTATFAVATTSILGSILATLSPAQAALVNFSGKGDKGYSVTGSFSYDETKTPTSFSEIPGAAATKYLQSFSITFLDPTNKVLESGSSIVNGISSDRFFRLDFNSSSKSFSALDGDIGGSSYQYFLTNLRTTDGKVVGPGITGFNLFYRPNANVDLDRNFSLQVTSFVPGPAATSVPEPTTTLGTLIAGGLGIALKRKQNKN